VAAAFVTVATKSWTHLDRGWGFALQQAAEWTVALVIFEALFVLGRRRWVHARRPGR